VIWVLCADMINVGKSLCKLYLFFSRYWPYFDLCLQ